MKILIGSDHAGYRMKEFLKQKLSKRGYEFEDVGTDSEESCDYPLIAKELAVRVAESKGEGILICGTGIGMSMAANKVQGVRASLCKDEFTAKAAREHNNANVLCLGARTIEKDLAEKIALRWLTTDFSSEPRHARRVKEIDDIEC